MTTGRAAAPPWSIPPRDVDQYLGYAAEHELDITHVFLTHFHADFRAEHLELRNRTGAANRFERVAPSSV